MRFLALPAALLADVLFVLAFVVIGRINHAEGLALEGVALTAWPFLAGLAGGWAATLPWKPWRSLATVASTGWLVVIGAAAGGLSLRNASGGDTPLSFDIVAWVFLGATLLGWRGVVALIRRLRTRADGAGDADAAVEAPQEA